MARCRSSMARCRSGDGGFQPGGDLGDDVRGLGHRGVRVVDELELDLLPLSGVLRRVREQIPVRQVAEVTKRSRPPLACGGVGVACGGVACVGVACVGVAGVGVACGGVGAAPLPACVALPNTSGRVRHLGCRDDS